MTDRLREAAQAALKALEIGYDSAHSEASRYHAAMAGYKQAQHDAMDASVQQIAKAITGLHAALAEPTCKQDLQVAEQDVEPFIWYEDDSGDTWTAEAVREGCAPQGLRPLYAAPPRRDWIGLTEEEQRLFSSWLDEKPDAEVFAAIEQTLKEKNHG